MARERVRQAVRKAAFALEQRQLSEADVVAVGVRQVARELAPMVRAGSLYWTAPVQYVCEQMAGRVCQEHGLPLDRREDVAGYLLAGFNEYIVAMVGEFDREHWEAWIAAQNAQDALD